MSITYSNSSLATDALSALAARPFRRHSRSRFPDASSLTTTTFATTGDQNVNLTVRPHTHGVIYNLTTSAEYFHGMTKKGETTETVHQRNETKGADARTETWNKYKIKPARRESRKRRACSQWQQLPRRDISVRVWGSVNGNWEWMWHPEWRSSTIAVLVLVW